MKMKKETRVATHIRIYRLKIKSCNKIKRHYIMIKRLIQQKYMILVKTYVPNIRTPNT